MIDMRRTRMAGAGVVLALAATGCISVIGGRHERRDNGGLAVEPGREVVVHGVDGGVAGRIDRTHGDWLILIEPSGAESWIRMSDISRLDYRP